MPVVFAPLLTNPATALVIAGGLVAIMGVKVGIEIAREKNSE